MYIFINSKSCDEQAVAYEDVISTIRILADICRHLQETYSDVEFYRDTVIVNRMISKDVLFKDALIRYMKQASGRERTLFTFLFDSLTKRPFAHNRFPEIVNIECCWEESVSPHDGDETGYAISYAAHFSSDQFKGIESTCAVLSLRNHSCYNKMMINVLYGPESERRIVWNISEKSHFLMHRRKYEKNQKHSVPSDLDGYVAPMTLDDREAEMVLNQGIKLEGTRRVIARKDGKIYIFPMHLEGTIEVQQTDEKELDDFLCEGYYHGYECTPQDLRSRDAALFSQLKKVCHWPELDI